MHIDDLRALAPLWLSKTEEVRQNKSHWSTNITGDIYGMGWISEMYGYSFGAAEVERSGKLIASASAYRKVKWGSQTECSKCFRSRHFHPSVILLWKFCVDRLMCFRLCGYFLLIYVICPT